MNSFRTNSVTLKFVVECFDNRDRPGERICRTRFEFDTLDEAMECARRIVDISLKQTRDASSTAGGWYRRWAAYGNSVVAVGTGFDSRTYAKRQIRSVIGPETEWSASVRANACGAGTLVT